MRLIFRLGHTVRPLLVVDLFDEFCNPEQVIHAFERHALVESQFAVGSSTLSSYHTFVSGTRNQTKTNMERQKQAKVRKHP